ALGAMHLMSITLEHLRNKGHEISNAEFEASLLAILLHDIGHGPFSHALEATLLSDVHHEALSLLFIEELNEQFNHQLDLTLKLFTGGYERPFFHQLASSQLDIDRVEYPQRDCFFTGVSEGTIGADRIIKMMNIKDEALVIEEKGIYSIENFLSARRLMYWQVYLHKTTVSAEKMLINLVTRAKDLKQAGVYLNASEELIALLQHNFTLEDFRNNRNIFEDYAQLDDNDIWGAVKLWKKHEDYILASISNMLLERKLFKINLTNKPLSKEALHQMEKKILTKLQIPEQDLSYFFSCGTISNNAYLANDSISI